MTVNVSTATGTIDVKTVPEKIENVKNRKKNVAKIKKRLRTLIKKVNLNLFYFLPTNLCCNCSTARIKERDKTLLNFNSTV